MTREKVIKVIESTFLDENIDKELYILYGTVLGGACGIIIKENKIEVYILDADNVNHCLISEDYRTAYEIYKKLHQLVGMLLNC